MLWDHVQVIPLGTTKAAQRTAKREAREQQCQELLAAHNQSVNKSPLILVASE